MRNTVLFAILLLGFHFSISQDKKLNKQSYHAAKINLKSFNQLNVKNLTVDENQLNFFDPILKKNMSLPFSEIQNVYVKSGNKFGKGVLFGGIFMAGVSISAFSEVKIDSEMELKDNYEIIIGGFILGGMVVGGLVGSFFPKWKPLKINHQPLSFNLNFKKIKDDKKAILLGVALQIN